MCYFPQHLVFFFFLLQATFALSLRTCPPRYCGNLQIKFPLWLKNSPSSFPADYYCGFPDLGVNCVNDEVILHAGNNTYAVKFFNQNSTRYTFKAKDLLDRPCPRARHNLTLIMDPGLPLRRGGNFSIFFYFNCTVKDCPLSLGYEPLPACIGSGKAKESFAVYSDASSKFANDQRLECEDIVESPVKKFLEGGNLSSGFAGALQGGFEMVVSDHMALQCVSCEVLNGVCTYAKTGGTEL